MARTAKPPAEAVSLLFAFRAVRFFQAVSSIAALAIALGAILMLVTGADDGAPVLLVTGSVLTVVFLFLFAFALRLPTSFVAISPERMRIRFPGFVDNVMPVSNVLGARLVKHSWWRGLGVRSDFGGSVGLVTASGDCAEIILREPLRVWVIPRILPVRARVVRLSVRNPARLVERFGPPPATATATKSRRRK